jgi:O-acetyl-ADP-ribose deacetylase (regulator of RNase III)
MTTDLEALRTFLDGRVVVRTGDITRETVDAVVNAANGSLLGGGGVDGAIHRAAGPSLLAECREIRKTLFPAGLPTGEAVMTRGYNLHARHVIHTVGPVWGQHEGREAELLASCYLKSIALASKNALSTLAFPAISTGIYGYPKDEAAAVASRALRVALGREPAIAEVRLVFFSPSDEAEFLAHHDLGDGERA